MKLHAICIINILFVTRTMWLNTMLVVKYNGGGYNTMLVVKYNGGC